MAPCHQTHRSRDGNQTLKSRMAETLRKVTKEKQARKGAGREWAVRERGRIEAGDVSLSSRLQMPPTPRKKGQSTGQTPLNTSRTKGAEGQAGENGLPCLSQAPRLSARSLTPF